MSAARAGRGPEHLTGVAALLLLLAVAVGLLGQGGYYGPVQRLVGLLVAAAILLATVAWPSDRDDARLLPVVPARASPPAPGSPASGAPAAARTSSSG
jgi:hypothetical protein